MKLSVLKLILASTVALLVACQASIPKDSTQAESPSPNDTLEIPTGPEIITVLGAKGVEGADPTAVAGYRSMFERLDATETLSSPSKNILPMATSPKKRLELFSGPATATKMGK